MKKLTILFFLLLTHFAYAQVPQGIPYQAAARNTAGQALVNTAVKVRFSILDSLATGTTVYQETHSTTTNSVGLFNVNVGMGTVVTGTFAGINWGKNAKFMKMELDITGTGSSYVDMGTQQMLSVPYAMYAESAATANTAQVLSGVGGNAGPNVVNVNDYNSVTINGTATKAYIPPYLYDCGDGSEGNFTVSGTYDASLSNTVWTHQYKNLTIPAGSTFSIQPHSTYYIYVSDTLKIQGTVYGKGNDAPPGGTGSGWSGVHTVTNSVGAGGGGSSPWTYSGQGEGSYVVWDPQTVPNYIPLYGQINTLGGLTTGAALSPTNTANGQSASATTITKALRLVPRLDGCEGAPTTYNLSYPSQTSMGGFGGSGVYFICKVLIFSGSMNLSGGKGANIATGYSGYYGGGGGGGSVVISAEQILQNTGTFNLNGGTDYLNSAYRKGGNGAYLIIDR